MLLISRLKAGKLLISPTFICTLGRRQSRTGITEKEALKQMRKPMIHLASYETCDKQNKENRASRKYYRHSWRQVYLSEGFDHHLHFKTKTESSAIHNGPT